MTNQSEMTAEEKLAQEILATIPAPACGKPAMTQSKHLNAKERLAANMDDVFAVFEGSK